MSEVPSKNINQDANTKEKTQEETELEKYQVKNRAFLKIFEELRQDTVYGVWILAIISIKDIFLPLIIIYGIQSPYLQIVPVIVILLFSTTFLIFTRPFKNKMENGVQIFT